MLAFKEKGLQVPEFFCKNFFFMYSVKLFLNIDRLYKHAHFKT